MSHRDEDNGIGYLITIIVMLVAMIFLTALVREIAAWTNKLEREGVIQPAPPMRDPLLPPM